MVQLTALPDFRSDALADLLAWADSDTPPPVDQWHPVRRGSIDIRIAADGRWYHEGGEIRRPAMIRLFSRILRREADGGHVLVTPAECLSIEVEDAAFVAVDVRAEGGILLFALNTGEVVAAGTDHPLVLRDGPAGRLPYLRVRGTADRPLEARLSRPVHFALAEQADERFRVTSAGATFLLDDSAAAGAA